MEESKVLTPANNKKKIAIFIFLSVAIIGIIIGYIYVQYKKTHITTEDAFITGRIHTVSSKVRGTIKNIHVADNQLVKKDAVLIEIDTGDFDVNVKEVASMLDAAKKQYEEFKSEVGTATADLELQKANLKQAETDMKRAENLFKENIIPKERVEKTTTGYDIAVAQVASAREELKRAEARLKTQQAFIKQREASLSGAELNLGYTKNFSPSDGYITRKSVQTGNHVQAGQPLMSVVPLDDIWVVANYKETQLERVKPGQKVEIKVDTYPDKKFRGNVDSIMAGTGSIFSLFPPENATGNYVKVVQRIPVKIIFDKDSDPGHILRIGMSVESTIIVEK
ncbi:MAG: HlyD family secretion protein [Bacteroidota bacterium]